MERQLSDIYQRLVLYRNIVCYRSTFNPETIIIYVSKSLKVLRSIFACHTTFTKAEVEVLSKIHLIATALSLVLSERTNLQRAVVFIQSH